MKDARTWLAVGGVVALVAVGALVATLAGGGSGGDDSANGSVPVEDVAVLNGQWTVVNDGSAPAPVQGVVRLVFGDGRVFADTGCTTVRGPVMVKDSVLVTTGPLMTRQVKERESPSESDDGLTERVSLLSVWVPELL